MEKINKNLPKNGYSAERLKIMSEAMSKLNEITPTFPGDEREKDFIRKRNQIRAETEKKLYDLKTKYHKNEEQITQNIEPTKEQFQFGIDMINEYTEHGVYSFEAIVKDLYSSLGDDLDDYLLALKQAYGCFYVTAPDNIQPYLSDFNTVRNICIDDIEELNENDDEEIDTTIDFNDIKLTVEEAEDISQFIDLPDDILKWLLRKDKKEALRLLNNPQELTDYLIRKSSSITQQALGLAMAYDHRGMKSWEALGVVQSEMLPEPEVEQDVSERLQGRAEDYLRVLNDKILEILEI